VTLKVKKKGRILFKILHIQELDVASQTPKFKHTGVVVVVEEVPF
jgi:hypothetical protein